MEFSPICGSRYENGPPGMDSIEVARVIDRGIRESKFIDFKKLCIKQGERVWSVMVDMYCINDDGNALDACGIAAVAALKLTKVPIFNEETEKVEYGEVSEDLPLKDFTPITMTFHKVGDKLFVDPNRDEEDTRDARIT
jgi:exosome complex component RRP42